MVVVRTNSPLPTTDGLSTQISSMGFLLPIKYVFVTPDEAGMREWNGPIRWRSVDHVDERCVGRLGKKMDGIGQVINAAHGFERRLAQLGGQRVIQS